MKKLLIWQWGRRGAGPRTAVDFAHWLRGVQGIEVALSLAAGAEILRGPDPPACDLPVRTYTGIPSYLARLAAAPFLIRELVTRIRALAPDAAICAMPGPLDLVMHAALRRAGVPCAVVVHDADAHPGDGHPMQMVLQRRLMRRADALIALSDHVAARITIQGFATNKPLLRTTLPPLVFGAAPPPLAHGGKLRLLAFGRLLPYKGLDLLADALARVLPRDDLIIRIVGHGPPSPELASLAALQGVTVENRWVPESELGALLAWSDALILSHREASQSGVASAALAAGRYVIATRVGGLAQQLAGQPGAWLCDPDSPSLAAALTALLTAPPPLPPPAAPSWHTQACRLAADLNTKLLCAAA